MALNPYDELVEDMDQAGPKPPPENPYLTLLDEGQKQSQAQLRETLRANGTTPEGRAEAIKLGQRVGQPPDVVERNLDVFKQQADSQDEIAAHILKKNPHLAKWLTDNPDTAPAAKDDLPSMIRLENNLTLGGTILRGVDNAQASFGRFTQWAGELSGSKTLTDYGQDVATFNAAQAEALGKKTSWDDVDSPWALGQYMKETLGENLPNMGAMMAGGAAGAAVGAAITGPAAPVGATVGGFIGAFFPALVLGVGEAQGKLKEIDPDAVATGAVFLGGSAVAAFDTALPGHLGSSLVKKFGRETAEQIARQALTKQLKPQFIRSVVGETAKSMATEGITEAVQEAIGDVAAAQGAGTPMDWQKTWKGMVEAGIGGALVGGTFGGSAAAVTHQTEVARYAAAQQQQLFFDELAAGATDSKLRERLPEAYRDFIAGATKDGPVESLYVGTEEFKTYWQGQGVNPAVMAQELTGSATALADAEEAGIKLAIPTADYATKVAATEHHGFFAREMTLSPDGLNAREAKAVQATLEEQALSITDAITKAAEDPVTELGGPIQQGLRAQLEADTAFQNMAVTQGVDIAAAANTYAAGVEAVFTNLAERLGADPQELFARFGLSIGTPGPQTVAVPGQQQLSQEIGDGTGLPDLDYAEAFLGAPEGASIELLDDDEGTTLNASGESGASAEAMSRLQGMKARGEQFGVFDRGGRFRPIIGADAVDYQPARGETFGVQGPDGFRTLTDNGGRVTQQLSQAARAKAVEQPSLKRAPAEVVANRLRMSTRVPTSKKAPAQEQRLRTDMSVVDATPDFRAKLAKLVATYPQVPTSAKTQGDDAVLEAFIQQGERNLRWLWDLMPAATRDRAKLWYIGAHRISLDLADEFGYTDPQAAALLAVLSPKMDWFKNVAFARVASRAFKVLERDNPAFDKTMFDHYESRVMESFERDTLRDILKEGGPKAVAKARKLKRQILAAERARYEGVKWFDLDELGQAKQLRAWVELNTPNEYPIILPEGEEGDLKRNKDKKRTVSGRGWTSFPITATAISVMRDGKPANLQEQLGGQHKVRSFFNNISDPWDPDSVTIDTHAVAAVHLQPFSTESPEVKKTMGGIGANLPGLSGANALYAEVYFRVAASLSEELGYTVLPREVQSVTWEAVRLLFPPEQKRAEAPAEVKALWANFVNGKITEEELHGQLANQPGRVSAPDWGNSPPRVALDEGSLRQGYGAPLRPDVSARRGDGGAGAPGAPRSNANLPNGPVVLFQGAAAQPAAAGDASSRRSTLTRILGELHGKATRPFVRTGRGAVEGVRGLVHTPVLPFQFKFNEALFPTPKLVQLERSDAAASLFHQRITSAKQSSKFGAAVYVYDQADYKDMRLFVTEDGRNGFAIKADGDIVSVFSAGGGNVHAMLALAVQEGGTKLDAFDTVLPDLYAVNGFKVVKRETWNEGFKPEGWDKALFAPFNGGEPDVVYMEYDPAALLTGPTTLFQSAAPLTGVEWAHSRLAKAVELSQLQRASGAQWKATIKNSKAGINQDEFLFAQVQDLDDATVYGRQEVLDYLKANQLQVQWATFSNTVSEAEVQRLAQQLYDWRVNQALHDLEAEFSFTPEPGTVTIDEDNAYMPVVDGEQIDDLYDTVEEAFAAAVSIAEQRMERAQNELRQQAANSVSWDDAMNSARERLQDGEQMAPFVEYTEDGADTDTYREVLLHSPQFGSTGYAGLTPAENTRMREGMAPERKSIRDALETRRFLAGEPDPTDTEESRIAKAEAFINGTTKRWLRRVEDPEYPLSESEKKRLQDDANILLKLKASGDYKWREAGWKDGHAQYAQVENPIVRLRFNQRTSGGQRVLFLEEVQPPQPQNFEKMPPLLQKNWREIAFKWALAHATEIGADAVAWTTGEMQAKRYSLADDVIDVKWGSSLVLNAEEQRYVPGGKKWVTIRLDVDDKVLELFIDENLKITEATESIRGRDPVPSEDGMVGARLDTVVGKDLATEIAESQEGKKPGGDITIGGTGLKKLYDEDFRNVVNKLPAVKKSGGRAGVMRLQFRQTNEEAAAAGSRRVYPPNIERMPRGPERTAAEEAFDAPMLERTKKEVPAILLTPELKASVQAGQALFQGERGFIRFGADRQFNIQLLKDADLSTVLHELGHFYLEVLGDLTAELKIADPTTLAPGQAGVLKDYQTILNWLGVQDRTQIGVEQHEQFARGFEAYLLTGASPSHDLQSAFARYRTWLVRLYRNVIALAVDVTPQVREVFDRLVASDDAIARAREEARIVPFATAEQAGMSDIEFQAYQETAMRANEAARDALQAKLMKQLMRERQAWWKQRQAAVRLEVAADVYSRPDQIARSVLTLGRMPEGMPAPLGAEDMKLSKDSIVRRYGKDRLKTLPKPWVYSVDGGMDIELAAQLFGFGSGDALLSAVAAAEKPESIIARETAQRMKAEFGDMKIDGTIGAAAKKAVLENGHDLVLAMELRAIAKKVREMLPFARAKQAAVTAEERSAQRAAQAALTKAERTPLEQVRMAAERTIAGIPVRSLKTGQYWAAARNAGQEALKAATAGKFEAALEWKMKQRLAVELHRAASNAIDEVDTAARYMRRFEKEGPRARLGKAGDTYLTQVDALLGKFEFARVSNKALDRRATLLSWVESRRDEGFDVSGIPAELLEAAESTNYRELTLEQVRVVRDAVKQIESLASLKLRLLKNADTRNFITVRDELVAQAALTGGGKKLPLEFREADRFKHAIATWFASHAKISRLARALDGYVDGGKFWSAIIRPLNEAADAERARNIAEGKRYTAILNKHYPGKELGRLDRKVDVKGVGPMSLEGRLAVALNWGNATSRDRLLNDPVRKFTEANIKDILATLDRRDWLFVQDTWDFVDSFWQEVSDKQQRVTGLRPEKVEAVVVETRHGVFRGGYYPLAYDARLAARPGQVAAASEAKLAMSNAYVQTTTRRGHVEARQQHVELPVRLDLGVLFNHLDQVIHDLTHHETLLDVSRLLRDKSVSQAIIESAGEPVYRQFTNAVSDIATGGNGAASPLNRAATFMRTGTQVAAMGFNFWTALQQPLGLFNGAARVGPVWVLRGMKRWMRDAAHMENTAAWINDVSPMMAARSSSATQDLADLRKTLAQPGGWFDTLLREVTRDNVTKQSLTDSYLWHIGLAQKVADIPTWLGAYEKAMASGVDEERAYRLADQAVLDAQGGGDIKDLAGVQRGDPVAKLFMVFYSYGNTVYNSTAEVYGRSNIKTAKGMALFLGNLSLLYVFPALGTVVLRRLMGGDDEDPFVVDMTQEVLATAMNTMVLVRELGGLVGDGVRGYSGPAGTRFVSLLYSLGQQLEQGEADDALWRALNGVAGVLFRYPAVQAQKTVDGWVALEEGRTSNPFALLTGGPR